jgi:hypothetical protein
MGPPSLRLNFGAHSTFAPEYVPDGGGGLPLLLFFKNTWASSPPPIGLLAPEVSMESSFWPLAPALCLTAHSSWHGSGYTGRFGVRPVTRLTG